MTAALDMIVISMKLEDSASTVVALFVVITAFAAPMIDLPAKQ